MPRQQSGFARLLPFLLALPLLAGCSTPLRSTIGRPPTARELAPLWIEPGPNRDLFYGPGGAAKAPRPDVVYELVERKTGGFSPKLEVKDPSGVRWSVKMGDEAQSEVTASRILWGLGYHQPFDYYLAGWTIHDETSVHRMGPARFRPHLHELKNRGAWAWHSNPFVDSKPFRGLLVLMMILNSTDLKDENNEIFRVKPAAEDADEWYTVKDLGASLGQTGRDRPKRNNIDYFEKQAFITGLNGPFVRFEFHGRHQDLIRGLTPADVEWMCGRLRRLSPKQRRDAFRAGGYDQATTERYLAKIDEKVAQGLAPAFGARQ